MFDSTKVRHKEPSKIILFNGKVYGDVIAIIISSIILLWSAGEQQLEGSEHQDKVLHYQSSY